MGKDKTRSYMRIGEMAKKAGVTVRTLQYYDSQSLLSPTAESEGGYRLYTEKDLVKLMQILMMKELGFPLSEIKTRMPSLDSPMDVVAALAEQAAQIRKKVEALTESLETIEALKAEIEYTRTVDFKKYGAILVNLQMKNEQYWMIKHLDDETLAYLSSRYSSDAEAVEAMRHFNSLNEEAARLYEAGVSPESEKAQVFAKTIWAAMMELTGGDMEILQKINSQVQNTKGTEHNANWNKRHGDINNYTRMALEAYFANQEGEDINDC